MANRYTQLSASEYKPLSMQELMIAPAMMRGKHDEALAKQQELSSGLNAYANPLNQHLERTRQLQNEMNSTIDQQADNLAKHGYSRGSGADMIRLNRRYQNLISPTGELGQINAAKEAYFKNREEFMKSSDAQKYGRAVAERNWNEHTRNYTGYDADGKVSQIGTLGAPENRTEMDAAQEAKKLVGVIKRESAASGGRVVAREDGSYAVINGTGSLLKSSNVDQLNTLLKAAQYEFATPGQRGYESAKFRGVTPEQSLGLLDSYFKGMVEDEHRDTRSSSISLSGVKNWKEAQAEQQFTSSEGGVVQKTLGPEYNNINSFNDARNKLIVKQNTKGGLTSEEMDQLRTYNNQFNKVKEELAKDPLYNEYNKKIKNANTKAGLPEDFKPEDLQVKHKMGSSWGRAVPVETNYFYKGKSITRDEYNKIDQKHMNSLKESRPYINNVNKMETEHLNKSSMVQMTMLETSSKSEKVVKAGENNLHGALADRNILANSNNIEIESISSSSEKDAKYIGRAGKEEFGKDFYKLMGSVSPDDIRARKVGFGPDGAYVQVSIKTDKKGDSYTVSGKKVKPGETLDVTFKVKATDGNYAINNPFANIIRMHTQGNMTALNTEYGGDGITPNYNLGNDVKRKTQNLNISNKRWGTTGISDIGAIVNSPELRTNIINTAKEFGIPTPTNIQDLENLVEYLKQNDIKVK